MNLFWNGEEEACYCNQHIPHHYDSLPELFTIDPLRLDEPVIIYCVTCEANDGHYNRYRLDILRCIQSQSPRSNSNYPLLFSILKPLARNDLCNLDTIDNSTYRNYLDNINTTTTNTIDIPTNSTSTSNNTNNSILPLRNKGLLRPPTAIKIELETGRVLCDQHIQQTIDPQLQLGFHNIPHSNDTNTNTSKNIISYLYNNDIPLYCKLCSRKSLSFSSDLQLYRHTISGKVVCLPHSPRLEVGKHELEEIPDRNEDCIYCKEKGEMTQRARQMSKQAIKTRMMLAQKNSTNINIQPNNNTNTNNEKHKQHALNISNDESPKKPATKKRKTNTKSSIKVVKRVIVENDNEDDTFDDSFD